MRRIISVLASQPTRLAEVIIASALISILGLAGSVYSIMVLRRYVGSGIDATLFTLTTGVLIALAFENLLRGARFRILQGVLFELDQKDSTRILAGFTLSQYDALQAIPPQRRREALQSTTPLQQAYSATNVGAILDVPFALVYLAVLCVACWPVGVITILAVVCSLIASYSGMRLLQPLVDSQSTIQGQFAGLSSFLLNGNESLRIFACLSPIKLVWDSHGDKSGEQRRQTQGLQSSLQQIGSAIASLLSISTYAVGAVQVVKGQLDIGTLIGLSILSSRCFQTCNRLTSMLDSLSRAKRAESALQELQDLPKEILKGTTIPDYKGNLELVSLNIRYPDQPLAVVEDLSIRISQGSVVGITGPNGSGKTSLMRVLTGLRTPSEGLIKLDSIELRQILPEWWRSQLAYVPQDLHFFDGSIRDNLITRQPDVSDEELLALCRECDLMGFLTQKQGGLHFPMRGNGLELPVGIRRRLALVRAMVGKCSILLLDEPTEGLDTAGIQGLFQVLKRKREQGVTMVIASNESYLSNLCDGIISLDAGPGYKLLKKELQNP